MYPSLTRIAKTDHRIMDYRISKGINNEEDKRILARTNVLPALANTQTQNDTNFYDDDNEYETDNRVCGCDASEKCNDCVFDMDI